MKRGKRYIEKMSLIDSKKNYTPSEGASLLKSMKPAKFDESIEIHFRLGIDPKHADQQLRGTLDLPHGTGKSVKIAVITTPDRFEDARKSGADYVGGDDLIEKIQKGWLEFDLLLATPDVMSKVAKLGRILGTKGLMPNPKSGTVTADLVQSVRSFKTGKVEYRNDKTGIVHLIIGKVSFGVEQLKENFIAVYERILKEKPAKSKGNYLKSITLCSTMGPGIKIEPQKLRW